MTTEGADHFHDRGSRRLFRDIRRAVVGASARAHAATRCSVGAGAAVLAFIGPGCGESKMTMDGTLRGEMKADLNGALRLEGPVQIQMEMRGPTVRYEGVFISERLLDRVEVNKTSTDWLLAVLGEPTGRAELRDGTYIWKWSYRPLEQEASVISVFGSGKKDEPALQPSTVFVRLRNDVVIEKWDD